MNDYLELFELMNPSEKDYSNTIELYDFIPKYVWGKTDRIQGKFLEPIEKEFNCRGQGYQVRISSARIKDSDGTSHDYFPNKRKELVKDALRKIATARQDVFLDNEASVTFTLYQLQQELKRSPYGLRRNKSTTSRSNRTRPFSFKHFRYDQT